MAIKQEVVSASFSIDVANGVDAAGDTKYKKKTFSGIKSDADTGEVLALSQAIQNLLKEECGNTYINVSSELSVQQ